MAAKTCPTCGATVAPAHQFCPKCGDPLQQPEADDLTPEERDWLRKRKAAWEKRQAETKGKGKQPPKPAEKPADDPDADDGGFLGVE